MQVNLARVVSHHPLRDVSIITWFAFLLGCRRFGKSKCTERDDIYLCSSALHAAVCLIEKCQPNRNQRASAHLLQGGRFHIVPRTSILQTLEECSALRPVSATPPSLFTQLPGFHFFWACCINLVGAAFLRLLLSAPRPFMYDQRLRPLTDRYETSHGLPSLETHMATVVAGWWVESGGGKGSIDSGGDSGVQPIVRLLAVAYICFVGFTRFVLSTCLNAVYFRLHVSPSSHGTEPLVALQVPTTL